MIDTIFFFFRKCISLRQEGDKDKRLDKASCSKSSRAAEEESELG